MSLDPSKLDLPVPVYCAPHLLEHSDDIEVGFGESASCGYIESAFNLVVDDVFGVLLVFLDFEV